MTLERASRACNWTAKLLYEPMCHSITFRAYLVALKSSEESSGMRFRCGIMSAKQMQG
jgi:hypothetical protein